VRRSSTLAWFVTAMLIATAPFVARAQFDEDASITPPELDTGMELVDTAVVDVGTGELFDTGVDATTAPSGDTEPGPRLPNGEPVPAPFLAADVTGCGCRNAPPADVTMRLAGVALALAGLAATARRRRR
jgi:hypothetical protein